jgi:hypothetical protein
MMDDRSGGRDSGAADPAIIRRNTHMRPPRSMMEVKPARAFDSMFICFSFPKLGVGIDVV